MIAWKALVRVVAGDTVSLTKAPAAVHSRTAMRIGLPTEAALPALT